MRQFGLLLLPAALLVGTQACAPGAAPVEEPQPQSAASSRSAATGVYTEAQASRGETLFQDNCGPCHLVTQFSGATFDRLSSGRTAGYVVELIRSTMPQDSPGRLSQEEYTDILAYMLQLNTFPAGEGELASDLESLRDVLLEVR